MSVEEKVWMYLVEHKTPATASTIAKRFIISSSHVSKILKQLTDRNIIDVVRIGKSKFYKIKD